MNYPIYHFSTLKSVVVYMRNYMVISVWVPNLRSCLWRPPIFILLHSTSWFWSPVTKFLEEDTGYTIFLLATGSLHNSFYLEHPPPPTSYLAQLKQVKQGKTLFLPKTSSYSSIKYVPPPWTSPLNCLSYHSCNTMFVSTTNSCKKVGSKFVFSKPYIPCTSMGFTIH